MKRSTAVIGGVIGLLLVGLLVWSGRKEPGKPTAENPTVDERVKEAEAARVEVLSRPRDPQARFRLARALRLLGRFAEAEPELSIAIQLGLPEPQAQREAVLIMAGQDWPPQMAGLFQKVVHDNPDDAEVLLAVADSYAAKTFWVSAEALYTRLIDRTPDRTELFFKRGVTRLRAGLSGTAVEDFRKVLAVDADRFEARLYLAQSLLGDARLSEAEQEFTTCREKRSDAVEPLVGLANCAIERNDLVAAEQLLHEAEKRASNFPPVLLELATVYLRSQRFDSAIEALRRLVILDPDHRQGHLLLAQALLASGNLTESKKHEQIYQALDRKEEERLAARRGMR